MLASLLSDKMTRERLSSRDLAKTIGVSHTTIIRVINQEKVDLETMQKVCAWLGVDLAYALNEEGDQALLHKVAMLIQSEPKLAQLFQQAVDDLENGKLSRDDLLDIVNYATFRLRK